MNIGADQTGILYIKKFVSGNTDLIGHELKWELPEHIPKAYHVASAGPEIKRRGKVLP